jgi:hypothetical protein
VEAGHYDFALIAQLKSRSARRRTRAKQALRGMGADAIEPLLALLAEETRRTQRNRPLLIGCYALCMGLFAWWLHHAMAPVYWTLIPVFVLLLIVIAHLQAASPAQVEATHLLANIQDMRAVGPLAEALEFRDMVTYSGTFDTATIALIKLLPRLQAGDANLLNERQRTCLYRALHFCYYRDYAELHIAILKALAQVGDSRSLPHIARLAHMPARTGPQERFRKAAQECLETLSARIEGQRAPHTLLRAAATTTEDLLHPAQPVPNGDPQQLLRAGHQKAEGRKQ